MVPPSPKRRAPRPLRTLFVAALALVAITCLNDRPAGPGGRARAIIHLSRVARGGFSCGQAPTIRLTKARVLLKDLARGDSAVAEGTFSGDTVSLSVEIPLTGAKALLDIFAQTVDSTGDTLFRAHDTVTAVAGQKTVVNYLSLWYAARDSILDGLSIAPRDSQVHAGANFSMRPTGYFGDGGVYSGRLRLGWITRDPTIATVNANGAITAFSKVGSTYVVASTFLGICDSTTVVVVPPVASIDVKPDTADIPRGGTIQLVVTLKDAGGNILTGRIVTWGSVNANASVDTTGLVTGLIANKGARIFALSEGKADTSGIGILPKPVATVAVTPKPGAVQQGSTLQMSAVAKDSQGIVNTDWPTVWSSQNTGLATVSATGLVTGVKGGTVGIIATIGGVADTSQVTVTPNGPTSTVVSPNPDTLFSLGDTAQLTAQAYIGTTPTTGTFTWATRDPSVVTVTSTGQVIAKANGSTYVVATEAGGTKDSSHVFVIQKVSSITVTPNPVQRYLGTNQAFTAAAADARGNAISGVTFTWGQSDPSITNINANTGAATMLAIGVDTIKATVGTVVGKAVLTVKSAITKISVTPAGITLTALQQTQNYSATAYDTLNNVMSGITFAWTSTNPSVASVPGSSGTTQTATAQANGITAVTATAQGVSGASTLTVA
ncbi:MAG TPA: Ig-like domain-containing protein, partial [Gemmatimonadaceae bacterium]|nr:Ig-like domain-containing protein [Gemmatimonadaceae bacterium]